MVVELFRDERGAGHEAEGLIEIREGEGPPDGVAALHLAPAIELGERGLACVASQFLDHDRHPVSSGKLCHESPSAPNPKFAHIVLQKRLRTSGSKGALES